MGKKFEITAEDMNKGKKNVQVVLPVSDVVALRTISEKMRVPISSLVSMVINEFIKKMEERRNKKGKSLFEHTLDMFDK